MPKNEVPPNVGFGRPRGDTGEDPSQIPDNFVRGSRVIGVQQPVDGLVIMKVKGVAGKLPLFEVPENAWCHTPALGRHVDDARNVSSRRMRHVVR